MGIHRNLDALRRFANLAQAALPSVLSADGDGGFGSDAAASASGPPTPA